MKKETALYKVFKVGKVSNRKKILRKDLTEPEAQRVVRSYKSSTRSIVCYTKQ